MIHLIYISSAPRWPSEEDLAELLVQARTRNLAQHITGLLLYHNATYIQVLEGEEKDVHEIYASIKKDKRNVGNIVILEEEITSRDFPNWSMGFRTQKNCTAAELPGFVDIFGHKFDEGLTIKRDAKAVKFLLNFARKV